jgi:DNA polymerase-3 subunit delta
MQIRSAAIDAFLKAPPPKVEIVLLHGRDAGLVRERSKSLEALVLGPGADAFRRIELGEPALKEDPGALYAEAAALAMMGGRKFIRVRISTEPASAALEAYVAARAGGGPRPDALIVIEAGELKAAQKLRKLAESCDFAAALACYPDDSGSLEAFLDRHCREAGARLTPQAKSLLLDRLGADRGTSRQELDKLLLYAGSTPEIEARDVLAIVGDGAAAELDQLIEAVLSGDSAATARLAQRLRQTAAPVRILRALSLQLDRIAAARSAPGGRAANQFDGRSAPAGGRTASYSQAQSTARHLGRWSAPMTARAQGLVLEAEISCKTTGYPAEAIVERTLLMIARAAREAPVG